MDAHMAASRWWHCKTGPVDDNEWVHTIAIIYFLIFTTTEIKQAYQNIQDMWQAYRSYNIVFILKFHAMHSLNKRGRQNTGSVPSLT